MKASRKFASLALLVTAGALVSACGSGKSVTDGGNGDGNGTTQSTAVSLPPCDTKALDAVTAPVELTFWHGLNTTLGEELTKLTDQYNASQSKVKIKLVNQGGYEQTIDAYLQGSQASRPDIVQTPEYMVQGIVDTESTLPIEACTKDAGFDLTQLSDRARTAYTTQGALYSMPFNVSNPVLFFNKSALTDAGLDPNNPPKSLEELKAACEAIVSKGVKTYCISLDSGFDNGGGWYIEQWFAKAGELYADNENGRTGRATKVLFNGQTGVDLLTFLQELISSKLAVNVGDNTSGQDHLLKMVDAKEPAAMTISTSAALGPVLAILKSGQIKGFSVDDLGIGPMPGPDGKPGALVGGASLWIVQKNDPVKAAAAWDYIKFLVSAETQSEWSSSTGYLPVNKGAESLDPLKTTYVNDPRFRVAYDQLLGAAEGSSSNGPILGPLREVRVVVAKAVAAIFKGGDVKEALTAAETQANSLISNYNALNG